MEAIEPELFITDAAKTGVTWPALVVFSMVTLCAVVADGLRIEKGLRPDIWTPCWHATADEIAGSRDRKGRSGSSYEVEGVPHDGAALSEPKTPFIENIVRTPPRISSPTPPCCAICPITR